MQPSPTPPALRQPTVVASSWLSYATAAGGRNLVRIRGPWTYYSPSACFKMAPLRLRFVYLFSVLSGIGGLVGIRVWGFRLKAEEQMMLLAPDSANTPGSPDKLCRNTC